MKARYALILLPLLAAGCGYIPSWAGGDKKKPVEKVEGERLSVMRPATALEPDAALAATPPELPGQEANDAWPQHGGNAEAHLTHPALPEKLASQQTGTAGDGVAFEYRLVIPPVAGGGMVFAMDAEGRMSAHDMKDISTARWVSPGVATEDEEPILGGGLAYENGQVFASSGKGLVAAFDANAGTEMWRQPLNIPIRSAPRVAGGHVYVVTVDSELYALDAKSGAVLWSHRGISEGKGFLIEATPTAAGDLVVAPYSSGEIHILNADDGTSLWSDTIIGPQKQSAISVFTGIGGDPVVAEGLLFVAGSSGLFAVFHLESGRRLWDQPISSLNTPWVADENVFVLTSDAVLTALNRPDGRARWAKQLPIYENEEKKTGAYSWSGPVLAGGRLLVMGAHGQLLEISPADGSITTTTEVPEGAFAAPIVAGGHAYFTTQDATLYAIY
jgi:outer membrane protein assembly factor BamB